MSIGVSDRESYSADLEFQLRKPIEASAFSEKEGDEGLRELREPSLKETSEIRAAIFDQDSEDDRDALELGPDEVEGRIRKGRGEIPRDLTVVLESIGDEVFKLNLSLIPMTKEKLESIAEALPELKELNLTWSRLEDRDLLALTSFKRLEKLSVCGCGLITDKGVQELIKLPFLSELDLTRCPLITKAGTAALYGLRNLRALKLDDAAKGDEWNELKFLLRGAPSDEKVESIISAMRKACRKAEKPLSELFITKERVLSRFDELKAAALEKIPLKLYVCLQLACFLELELPAKKLAVSYLFSKAKLGIPRTVFYAMPEKKVYLLAESQYSALNAEGTYKRVTDAVELDLQPLGTTAKKIAWSSSKTQKSSGSFAKPEDQLKAIKEALLVLEKLKGLPGIAQTHRLFSYVKTLVNDGAFVTVPKLSVISERYDDNIGNLIRSSTALSFEQVVAMAAKLGAGLAALHSLKYAHADFKPSNCLYKHDPVTDTYSAAVTDFGFSFHVDKDDPTFTYHTGYYGTCEYTSPEQFGVKDFKGSYFKTDVFALGVTLYKLYFKKTPSWISEIKDRHDNDYKVHGNTHLETEKLSKAQNAVREKIVKEIEVPLEALLEKSSRTPQEEFECLIYRLLQTNVELRMSCDQFVEAITPLIEANIW